MTAYRTSDTGRPRRTKDEIDGIRQAIYQVCAQYRPVTVRQVFYRLVSQGLIAKTESEYRSTVARLMGEMRRSGELPFSWVADNTRWQRRPTTYDGMMDMLSGIDWQYRRDLWTQSDVEVEIWLEKEALAGVLYGVTEDLAVNLMVTRGYPSMSFTYSAAHNLGRADETFIYYFGDLDSHGLSIEETVQSHLIEFGAPAFTFERIAVTEEQVADMNLITRPDKGGRSWAVEVDAIEPDKLRQLCRDAIEQHIDTEQLARIQNIERIERSVLAGFKDAAETWALDDRDEDELAELASIADHEGGVALMQHLADEG